MKFGNGKFHNQAHILLFNMWYVDSSYMQISLCIVQEVANRMALDTRKTSSLWKDQALVEVNIAVLHSFQVRIWNLDSQNWRVTKLPTDIHKKILFHPQLSNQ